MMTVLNGGSACGAVMFAAAAAATLRDVVNGRKDAGLFKA